MIRNVILDIGDVLVRSNFERFFKKQGYDDAMVRRLTKATFLSPAWRELDREVWSMQEVMDAFIRNDPGIEDALRSVFRNTEGVVTRFPYAESWIRSLKASGLEVYCLSNLSGLIYDGCVRELDFLGMVDGYILSWREKLAKPDPAIYQLLLGRFGLQAEECIYIDDAEINVKAAEQLGMRGIVFRSLPETQRTMQCILNRNEAEESRNEP